MADKRLPGNLATIPTAKEQGFDIEWPIIRGFYMGPKVSDADYKVWVDTFNKMMATPAYDKLRAERGLFPFDLVGAEADAYVKKRVADYRKLAAGLRPGRRQVRRPDTHRASRRAAASGSRRPGIRSADTRPGSLRRASRHQRRHPMSDRILGAVCVVAAAGMAWAAQDYAAAISYEPVGPRAFPLLLAGADGASAAPGWCAAADRTACIWRRAHCQADRRWRWWRCSSTPRCSRCSASRSPPR